VERARGGPLTETPDDSLDGLDERALVARIACGDQAALQQLYAAYRPRLWRFLYQQLGGDAGLVEEVLQDVFVGVWRHAGDFRGEARVATWLFRIARHRALNARRDAGRRRADRLAPVPDQSGEHAAVDPGLRRPSPEDEVAGRLALADALARLSAKHREALDLVFSHGFSLEEAARVLDVPVGTVKSRLSYARRALAGHLAPGADAEGSAP